MTSTPNPTPNHPAHTILSRTHPPSTATQIFTDKIKNKPLLLTPTKTEDKRALRRKIREHKQRYYLQHRKPRPLSAKEQRELKLHELRPKEVRYDLYKGLNALWTGYILEVLGFTRDGVVVADAGRRVVTAGGHGSLLASADFHGMEVEVVQCKDVGRVGLRGIVVRETKGTLAVVTEKDQLRVVLKNGAVFRVVVELPGDVTLQQDDEGKGEGEGEGEGKRRLVYELHGSQLDVRPVERAVKKFKWHPKEYL